MLDVNALQYNYMFNEIEDTKDIPNEQEYLNNLDKIRADNIKNNTLINKPSRSQNILPELNIYLQSIQNTILTVDTDLNIGEFNLKYKNVDRINDELTNLYSNDF